MRCENCGADIKCKAAKCPLCHAPMNCDGETPFPAPKIKVYVHAKLSLYYLVFAAAVNAFCFVVNFLTDTSFLWCVMVLVCFVYLYYFVRVTVMTQRGFHKRIIGQTLILTAIFAIIRLTVRGNYWIYITWLPIVYFVSDVLMFVFVVLKGNEAPKYIATMMLLCILGCIPTISAYVFDLSVKWPSVAATSVSGLMLIATLIVYRKNILGELKKVFHL
jgi:hypothetical protein